MGEGERRGGGSVTLNQHSVEGGAKEWHVGLVGNFKQTPLIYTFSFAPPAWSLVPVVQ